MANARVTMSRHFQARQREPGFSSFSKLPREIRDEIWRQSLAGDEHLQYLAFSDRGHNLMPNSREGLSSKAAVVLSRTCRESRAISAEDTTFVLVDTTNSWADLMSSLEQPGFRWLCQSIRTLAVQWERPLDVTRVHLLFRPDIFPQLRLMRMISSKVRRPPDRRPTYAVPRPILCTFLQLPFLDSRTLQISQKRVEDRFYHTLRVRWRSASLFDRNDLEWQPERAPLLAVNRSDLWHASWNRNPPRVEPVALCYADGEPPLKIDDTCKLVLGLFAATVFFFVVALGWQSVGKEPPWPRGSLGPRFP